MTMLTIIGSLTRNIIIDSVKFNAINTSQIPVKIDSNVTAADISITNSPDNNVATNYFDPAGLDQKDPQVFTFNNGLRANSKNVASVIVAGNTTSFSPTTSFASIDFGTSAVAGSEMEGWELLDSQTGRVKYIGKNLFIRKIVFSLSSKIFFKVDNKNNCLSNMYSIPVKISISSDLSDDNIFLYSDKIFSALLNT